jgi:malate synthase
LTVFQVKLDQGAQEAEAQIQFERLLQALGQERVQAWLQQASELKQVQVQRNVKLCLNCMAQWHNGMVCSAETVWHNVTSIC